MRVRSPDHARDAIIKGLLSLESEELITAIYLICSQAESYIHEARSTFDGMPDGIKKAYFEDRRLEEGISLLLPDAFPSCLGSQVGGRF